MRPPSLHSAGSRTRWPTLAGPPHTRPGTTIVGWGENGMKTEIHNIPQHMYIHRYTGFYPEIFDRAEQSAQPGGGRSLLCMKSY